MVFNEGRLPCSVRYFHIIDQHVRVLLNAAVMVRAVGVCRAQVYCRGGRRLVPVLPSPGFVTSIIHVVVD